MHFRYFWIFQILLSLHFASSLEAQTLSQTYGDSLTKQAQTIYVKGTVGMTSFDSEAAGSKESINTTEQEIGGWLGESRVAGIKVTTSNSLVPYELNAARSKTSITDVRMMARFWLLEPSIGISISEIDVNRATEKVFGVISTGLNAGLGLIVNLHQGLVFHADLMKVHETRTYDKLNVNSRLGDREDADAHFAFDVTEKLVDFIVGYKVRTYTMGTPDASFKESSQGVYAGLRMGYYF